MIETLKNVCVLMDFKYRKQFVLISVGMEEFSLLPVTMEIYKTEMDVLHLAQQKSTIDAIQLIVQVPQSASMLEKTSL